MAILDAKTVFIRNMSIAGSTAAITGSTTWSGAIADGAAQVVDQGLDITDPDKINNELDFDAVGQELTLKAVAGDVAIAGATNSTVQIKLQTASTNSNASYTDMILSPAISINAVPKGTTLFECRIPPGSKRYLRATVTVSGTTASAGKISVFATRDL